MIPIGIAIRVDNKIAYNASGIETPILAITNSDTGTLYVYETPKSPINIPEIQL